MQRHDWVTHQTSVSSAAVDTAPKEFAVTRYQRRKARSQWRRHNPGKQLDRGASLYLDGTQPTITELIISTMARRSNAELANAFTRPFYTAVSNAPQPSAR